MSLARIKATGLGKPRHRLVIGGCPYVFCSDTAMEQTAADGRIWVSGLDVDAVIKQIGNPMDVVPKVSGHTFRVRDRLVDDVMTKAFAYLPDVQTWLTDDLPRAGTTATVADETQWNAGDIAHVGIETVKVGGTATAQLTSLTRGYWDTTDHGHFAESGPGLRLIEVTNRPRSLKGRTAFLYAYGEGDSPTGNGTLIWTGVVSKDPQQSFGDDGVWWSVAVDNTARRLGVTIGEQLGDDLQVRGAYYHQGCYLYCEIAVHSGTGRGSAIDETCQFSIGGAGSDAILFESQEAFCEEFNSRAAAAIAAGITSGTPEVRAVSGGPTDWRIECKIDGSTPRYMTVDVFSPIDGASDPRRLYDSDYTRVNTVSAAEVYHVLWQDNAGVSGARQMPRGGFGDTIREPFGGGPGRDPGSGSSAGISRTIYVSGDVDLTGVDMVLIEWPSWADRPASTRAHYVQSVDTANRALVLNDPGEASTSALPHFIRAYAGSSAPKVKINKALVRTGHLGDLSSALVTEALDNHTKGQAPWITGDELGSWTSTVEAVSGGRPVVLQRDYVLGADIELAELYRHECRMLGLFIGFSSTGSLTPIQIKTFAATDPGITDVTVMRKPRPSWRPHGLGVVGGMIARTGYQPLHDKWEGPTIHDRDVTSESLDPTAAVVMIEPRSVYPTAGGDGTSARDLKELMQPLIGAYGRAYVMIGFEAPFTAYDVRMGDGVRFSAPSLPDLVTGTRIHGGTKQYIGQVIGRTEDWKRGRMKFLVHVPVVEPNGYSPAFGVTNETNVTGNIWDLTVRIGDPYGVENWGEAGDVPSDFVEVNDLVEIYKFNSSSPSPLTGTLSRVTDPDSLRVTFDGVFTPGAVHQWCLRYRGATQASTHMQLYGYWAGNDLRIGFSSPADADLLAA